MITAEFNQHANEVIASATRMDEILRLLSLAWLKRNEHIHALANLGKDIPELRETIASVVAELNEASAGPRALGAIFSFNDFIFPIANLAASEAESYQFHDTRILARVLETARLIRPTSAPEGEPKQ